MESCSPFFDEQATSVSPAEADADAEVAPSPSPLATSDLEPLDSTSRSEVESASDSEG